MNTMELDVSIDTLNSKTLLDSNDLWNTTPYTLVWKRKKGNE